MTVYCGNCKMPTVPVVRIVTENRERERVYVSDCCECDELKDEAGEPASVDEVIAAIE